MADDITPESPALPERIEDLNIERELHDSYLTYAMSTIMDRALPDVRDGLKPSQRRILVTMNDLNLGPRSKHRKCAKITGDTTGNYHPHGNTVVYPTLVRMGQDWVMRHTLVDPQGNFGSSDGDPPAAERYTEARMTSEAMELLADMKLDTVDYQPNYEETTTEPVVLPAKFPNLLVNGSTGIAVGMACNLLPHNLGEVCDAIVKVIEEPDVPLAALLDIVPGPDFPTGGILMGRRGVLDGYTTGRGRCTVRAKTEVEEDKKGRRSIVVTELPFGVIRKNICEGVAEAAKNDKIPDVSGVNDESGRKHACRIVIDLKKGAEPEVVLNQLYRFTQCQITVSMINIALVRRQPRTLGLKDLIVEFIAHRREVITRRTRHLLKKAQQRGHILEGLIYAVVDIDEVIRIIRSSRTRDEAIEKLAARRFQIAADHPYAPQIPPILLQRGGDDGTRLSRVQAEAIGRLQLIQLVGLEIEKLTNEYRDVVAEIEDYERILGSEAAVLDIVREDTLEIKEKYANPRRTLIEQHEAEAIDLENLITPEEVAVTLSHGGYIKRLPIDTYRSQNRGGRGIKGLGAKEGDFVEHLFVANTHDHLLFFTNTGRVYVKRVFNVPEMGRTSAGRSLANLLDFQQGERVAGVLTVSDFEREEAFLLFCTRKGTVKKTLLSAYSHINRNGIIAINLADDDELLSVALTGGDDEVLLGTKQGMAVRFEENDVRAMGRNAGGVRGVRLAKDDEVVGMIIVPNSGEEAADDTDDAADDGEVTDAAGPMVLVATENGYGKRTPVGQYRKTRRGTKGVKNIRMTDRNGPVVGMLVTHGGEDLMLITEKGILNRQSIDGISAYGRAAAGVRIIRVDDGDRLVALAKVEADEEE
jgi:DNA gyrase subunit A